MALIVSRRKLLFWGSILGGICAVSTFVSFLRLERKLQRLARSREPGLVELEITLRGSSTESLKHYLDITGTSEMLKVRDAFVQKYRVKAARFLASDGQAIRTVYQFSSSKDLLNFYLTFKNDKYPGAKLRRDLGIQATYHVSQKPVG